MVLESIHDLDVVVCFVWPHTICLARNPIGHDEDIVSTWGVFSHSTSDKEEVLRTIYISGS